VKQKFRKGDLVRHSSYKDKRQYGIIMGTMPKQYHCLWMDGSEEWVRASQLVLVARGQNGKES